MWLFFIYETFQKKNYCQFFQTGFCLCTHKVSKPLNLCDHIFYLIWLKKKKKKIEFAIINAELKSVGFSGYLKHVYG